MELKTYQARSMSEALARVKADLGRDAVILHTRNVRRGGFLGIGSKSFVEITATTDARVTAVRARKPGAVDRAVVPLAAAPVSSTEAPEPSERAAGAAMQRAPEATAPDLGKAIDKLPPAADNDDRLRAEVLEIRRMVEGLVRRQQDGAAPNAAPTDTPGNVPAELVDFYTRLIGQDVAGELASDLLKRVAERVREAGAPHWDAQGRLIHRPDLSDERINAELRACIAEMLPPAAPVRLTNGTRPTVVVLVGPTGVGKTTTIAKLAANMKLREGKSVGLITIDTYRIAAVEQLKTYAQILKVPLTAVMTPAQMAEAIHKMHGLDLLLIDTAGRSQKDRPKLDELREFLDAAAPDQVHLVLSSTSREETIQEAIDRFSALGARHVIFTKLDEAIGFGVLLNVLRRIDLQLSYVTDGQSVPGDIEAGSAQRIARLLLGESLDAIRADRADASPSILGQGVEVSA